MLLLPVGAIWLFPKLTLANYGELCLGAADNESGRQALLFVVLAVVAIALFRVLKWRASIDTDCVLIQARSD